MIVTASLPLGTDFIPRAELKQKLVFGTYRSHISKVQKFRT
jgi:hypothetical protein